MAELRSMSSLLSAAPFFSVRGGRVRSVGGEQAPTCRPLLFAPGLRNTGLGILDTAAAAAGMKPLQVCAVVARVSATTTRRGRIMIRPVNRRNRSAAHNLGLIYGFRSGTAPPCECAVAPAPRLLSLSPGHCWCCDGMLACWLGGRGRGVAILYIGMSRCPSILHTSSRPATAQQSTE